MKNPPRFIDSGGRTSIIDTWALFLQGSLYPPAVEGKRRPLGVGLGFAPTYVLDSPTTRRPPCTKA